MNQSKQGWMTLVPTVIIAVGVMLYLLVSQAKIGFGFPLDDAWIHQTYARNLGRLGQWAFVPGQSSAGSTGPLWSVLISLAYWWGIPHLFWTYLLGSGALVAMAILAGRWYARRTPEASSWWWVVAVVVGLEWHMLWSALSGMETIAIASLSLTVLFLLDRSQRRPAAVGFLIGIGLWVRPDALLLVLPVAWVYALGDKGSWKHGLRDLAIVGGVLVLVAIPYLLMNFKLVGEIWPTTFFAKQAEYASLRQLPILTRLWILLKHPLTGTGIVVLPGLILELWRGWRQRSWAGLAPFLWLAAYLGAYALRLPVAYQHGRYAMPVIPILLVTGLSGMGRWLRLESQSMPRRVISRTWAAVLIVVMIAFVGIGAKAYATDVGVIETEMVAASLWIRDNTSPQALIAAHDIGALGYFGQRQIVDLAGLVTPDVVPILRNEPALANYMNDQGVDYFMTFPGWYPQLTPGLPVVFTTQGAFSPSLEGENMTVYDWLSQ